MSAGSDASNMGYGNINPITNFNNINSSSSNYSAGFTSTQIPCVNKINPLMNGGTKRSKKSIRKIKRKIKNIVKSYKTMTGTKIKTKRRFNKLRRSLRKSFKRTKSLTKNISRGISRSISRGRQRSSLISRHMGRQFGRQFAGMKGGYSQFESNVPATASYSTGGIYLPPSQLALANPVPYTPLTGNCIDNYNRMTNTGFSSK